MADSDVGSIEDLQKELDEAPGPDESESNTEANGQAEGTHHDESHTWDFEYDSTTEFSTGSGADEVSAVVPVRHGADLDEAIELWGEDTVFNMFSKLFTRKVQNTGRRMLKQGDSYDEIVEASRNYDPNETRRGRTKDPQKDAKKAISQMSAEEKQALMDELRGELGQ